MLRPSSNLAVLLLLALLATGLHAAPLGGWPVVVELAPGASKTLVLPSGKELSVTIETYADGVAQVKLQQAKLQVQFGPKAAPVAWQDLLVNGEYAPGFGDRDVLSVPAFDPQNDKIRLTLWPKRIPEKWLKVHLFPTIHAVDRLMASWLSPVPKRQWFALPSVAPGLEFVPRQDLAFVMRTCGAIRFLRCNTAASHGPGLLDALGGWSQLWFRDGQFLYLYANLGRVLGKFRLGEPLEAGRTFAYKPGTLGQDSAPLFGLYLLKNRVQRDYFEPDTALEKLYPGYFIDPRPLLAALHQSTFHEALPGWSLPAENVRSGANP